MTRYYWLEMTRDAWGDGEWPEWLQMMGIAGMTVMTRDDWDGYNDCCRMIGMLKNESLDLSIDS